MPKENLVTDQTKNKKYTFAQRDGDDFSCVKIIEDGQYKDVIYKYGKVAFAKEEKQDGTLPMKFDYTVLKNPNNLKLDNQAFIDYIGDILIELLDEQINNGTAVIE
jgi:hypothetical protein